MNANSQKSNVMLTVVLKTVSLVILLLPASTVRAQEIDWKTTVGEAVGTLQRYLQINTTNPPGDVTEAAD
ncbi:MAG: hypothetical protein KC643_32380, partial [Nitrospira sp.]|nr:hypothetical protein [Nitrospira sp.]